MSETLLSDTECTTLLAGWLKSMKPAKPRPPTLVERIKPWRHGLSKAIEDGFTWAQLAKDIATKPEIGLKISGNYLKKLVHDAFVAMKEAPPSSTQAKRHRKRKKSALKLLPPASKSGS